MTECRTCKRLLDDNEFQYRPHSGTYRTACRNCESAARMTRGYNPMSPARRERRNRYASEYDKRLRSEPSQAGRVILKDTRNSDQKKGFENDLTREFVDCAIRQGCSYCGELSIRMTLDRIDNQRGHTRDNVVPACYRCNMIRGNMPYEAWLNVVPAIRDTKEKGLFGLWVGFGPWGRRHQEIGG